MKTRHPISVLFIALLVQAFAGVAMAAVYGERAPTQADDAPPTATIKVMRLKAASGAPAAPVKQSSEVDEAVAPAPASAMQAVAPEATPVVDAAPTPVKDIWRSDGNVQFQALTSDKTVRGVLNRWSQLMQLQDVVWGLDDADIPVERSVNFGGDFIEALSGLMEATSHSGQPARACLHGNGVIRVIARTRFCE